MSRKKKFPSKIWVGEFDQVRDKPELDDSKIEYAEYTNLSDVWHDASKDKQPQGVCDNNAVLVVGLRNERVSYKYLWVDMEDCWQDLDLLTPPTKKLYDKVLWAYVRDLVPGAKGKGE